MNQSPQTLAPVVLFVYARPDHTRRTLDALAANTLAGSASVFVYSDGPKQDTHAAAVQAVRSVLAEFQHRFGSFQVIERAVNLGLARSIIAGVSDLVQQHGRVIVLEDDLVTAPGFLRYMNDALDRLEADQRVFSVTGFNYPAAVLPFPPHFKDAVYMAPRACSWGWGTWADRWQTVDWNVGDFERFMHNREAQQRFMLGGEDLLPMLKTQMAGGSDSWAIRFNYGQFKRGGFTVYPRLSLVDNVGMDGSGVHWTGESTRFRNDLTKAQEPVVWPSSLHPDARLLKRFRRIGSPTAIELLRLRVLAALRRVGLEDLVRHKVRQLKRWLA